MMSTWTSSVMDRPAYGIATAHASHFLHVAVSTMVTAYGMATAHASHFFARGRIYYTMVTLFRQSIDNTVLISEVLRKPSYL